MPPSPRKIALNILNTLDATRTTLDRAMDAAIAEGISLSRRDRALLNALVYGVLRWRGRIDWIIDHFSKTPFKKIDPPILNILRLGLFQIIYLDRIPLSAAVNTSVEMAKSKQKPWVAGFVNALLRNGAKRHRSVLFPDPLKNPTAWLSAEKSFPPWLIKKWLARFGIDETGNLCDAVNTIPPITARTNTLKTTRRALLISLENEVLNPVPTDFSPSGIRFSTLKTAVADIQSFKNGEFQIQDEAAQIISMLLNPQPDETILDACAGLGGKTGHIAQLMKNRGSIAAVDNSSDKLHRLEAEMKRLGIKIVTTRRHDLLRKPIPGNLGLFDRILLDAPCSGLGVIRRNPDTKWAASKKDLSRYQARQISLLTNLAPRVKQNGRLVYAVCSTEVEENEAVVEYFLQKNPCFTIDKTPIAPAAGAASLISPKGWFRSFPHQHDMDGFFAICFIKTDIIINYS